MEKTSLGINHEVKKGVYAKNEIVIISLLSFRFSQGSPNFEKLFFKWLALNYPERYLPPPFTQTYVDALAETKERAKSIILKQGSSHIGTLPTRERIKEEGEAYVGSKIEEQTNVSIDSNLNANFRTWGEARESAEESHESIESSISSIAQEILGTDSHILEKYKRKNSFYIDYVVNGKLSGSPEFNELFKQLNTYHQKYVLTSQSEGKNELFKEVQELVNKNQELSNKVL